MCEKDLYGEPKYNLAILVVLYNCKLNSSLTLEGILGYGEELTGKKVMILVWNNGPENEAEFEEIMNRLSSIDGVNAKYFESINNVPLSKIYNRFVESVDSDAYLIFDHDSRISKDFFKTEFTSVDADFIVPHIFFNGGCYGPTYNGGVVEWDGTLTITTHDDFFAVGSGLVLRKKGIEKLRRHYSAIFDENFALYGVDNSFWLRVKAISDRERFSVCCMSSLLHSLSRLERESSHMVEFRRKERGLDFGITLRHYPSMRRFLSLIKLVCFRAYKVRTISGNSPSITWVMRGFLAGKHPRCKP